MVKVVSLEEFTHTIYLVDLLHTEVRVNFYSSWALQM